MTARGRLVQLRIPQLICLPTVLPLQPLDVVPQKVGVGSIEQSPLQKAAPSLPRPIPTPIHDHEAGEVDVDDPHFDLDH